MKKTVLTMAVLAMTCTGALQAQNTFSLRAGVALPTGNYADATADYTNGVLRYGLLDKTKKGGASTGFTVGAQGKFGIKSVKGLGITVSADFFFNSTNADVRDYFDEDIDTRETSTFELSYKLPKYIHIPIMAGIDYTYDLNEHIGFYGEGALGVNVRIISKFEQYSATPTTETLNTATYKTAAAFAYRFGAGIVINKRYNLGIAYYGLGSSKVEGETSSEVNGQNSPSTTKLKGGTIAANNFTVRLGITF